MHANFSANTRICFVSSRSGFVSDHQTILMDWANGRLIHQLALQYKDNFSVAIFGDSDPRTNHDFKIRVRHVYSLPFPFSYVGGLVNFFRILRTLKEIARQNDLLVVQLPFPGFLSLLFIRKPTVYHLCANVLTAASNPFKYRGVKRIISRSFALAMHRVFRILLTRSNVRLIANGRELAEAYFDCKPRATVSSSIYESEIVPDSAVNRRAPDDQFRLLFVGRPSKEKGFPTLMEAFAGLRKQNYPMTLFLLGVKKEDLTELMGTGLNLPDEILRHVTFQDYLPWGNQFKTIVMSSHALVVCSVSEGTPRVLIESRALGCPVVATRVGGIPSSVTHEVDGLLFEAEDVQGLELAIIKLMNEKLRQQLIRNGLQTVKNHTLEKFSGTFVSALADLQESNES